MKRIKVSHPDGKVSGHIKIGGSKSISNRVLILNALSEHPGTVSNLSDSDDTQTLQKLLVSSEEELDAHHAGTTFRFLTAYLCLQKETRILTGSERMLQRPVGPLVEALKELGADIAYLGKEGYPPLRISGPLVQKKKTIKISSEISSQFISALCMIGPCLEHGLSIELVGELVSKPYLEMTLSIMRQFGVESTFDENIISISKQTYISQDYIVESDWSSASYHFALVALAKEGNIRLEYLLEDSLQGDSIIRNFCESFGVQCINEESHISLSKKNINAMNIAHDFMTHPDLAQTIAVIAAGLNMQAKYKGLKTLFIKETDRVAALTTELAKVGITIQKDESGEYEYVQRGELAIENPEFETYQDHRMAMAFAPLALLAPVVIKNPKVVNKSYPNFWKDLETLGFVLEYSS